MQNANRSRARYIYGPVFATGLLVLGAALVAGIGGSIVKDGRFPPVGITYFPQIKRLIDDKRLAEAEKQLRLSMKLDPDHRAASYYLLAGVLFTQGQVKEARFALEASMSYPTYPPDAHNRLAGMLEHSGDEVGAIRHYEQAVRSDPAAKEAHYRLGRLYQKHHKLEQAAASYQRTLEVLPDHAEARQTLYRVLLAMGRHDQHEGKWEQAVEHYRRAAQIDPQTPQPHYLLGQLRLQQHEPEQAEAHFQTAVGLQHDHLRSIIGSSQALQMRNKTDQALARLHYAINVAPREAMPRAMMGLFLEGQSDVRGAVTHYRQALERDPDVPNVANSLAWILATTTDPQLRDPDQAVALARHASALSQDKDPRHLHTLAVAYAIAGKQGQAAATAEKAKASARATGDKALLDAIGRSLARYGAGRATRESTQESAP